MFILSYLKNKILPVSIKNFFIFLYLLITFLFLFSDVYIQYKRKKILSRENSTESFSQYVEIQRYEVLKFLKIPLNFISQIKWMVPFVNSKEKADFFSYIIRSMNVYPEVEAVSIILNNGVSVQLEKKSSSGSSFVSTDEVVYKGVVIEKRDTLNVLNEVSFGNTYNVLKQNILELKKKERSNQNYFLFSSYDQLALQPWFQKLKKSQIPLWIPPSEVLGINKGFYLTVVYPLRNNDDDFIGVIMAHVPEDVFSNRLKSLSDKSTSVNLFLVDSKGRLVGSSDPTLMFSDKERQVLETPLISNINRYDLSSIYKKYIESGFPNHLVFPSDRKGYESRMVSFSSFLDELKMDWMMISLGYEKSSTAYLKNFIIFNIFNTAIICFCYFFLVLLLKKSIAHPLNVLRRQLEGLTNSQDAGVSSINSYLPEIRDMVSSCAQLTKIMNIIVKFVPSAISKYFINEKKEIKVFAEKVFISNFFCDMGGFTHISEKMLPEELLTYISFSLDSFTKIITDNSGMVDQYVGDAISAFWGAPYPVDHHVPLACRTALECMRHLTLVLNPYLIEQGSPPLFISFGVSCGYALVGNIGTSDRMQYTSIGSQVTASELLQELNRYYRTRILVDQNVYEVISHSFGLRPVDKVLFKKEEIMAYELLTDFDNETVDSLAKISFISMQTRKAWGLYQQKSWKEAKAMYESILKVFPQDSVAFVMSQRCEKFMASPPDESWNGFYHY